MRIEKDLAARSGSICELCGSDEQLTAFEVSGGDASKPSGYVHACNVCVSQMNDSDLIDENHWRCLNDSMWNEHDAVKVMAWRMLNRVEADWTKDLLDMMYMEEEAMTWAKSSGDGVVDDSPKHFDSNGNQLFHGDTVVLTETLKVKGSSAQAKRGYAVRNISLVHGNVEQIEGKVEGQQIVILTKFVKKKL